MMTSKTKKIINTLALSDTELDKAIKIANTIYDRHIKFTEKDVQKMRKLYSKGFSLKDIAGKFDASIPAIKYRVDDEYRESLNKRKRPNTHYGKTMAMKTRLSYKRQLVAAGKLFAEV